MTTTQNPLLLSATSCILFLLLYKIRAVSSRYYQHFRDQNCFLSVFLKNKSQQLLRVISQKLSAFPAVFMFCCNFVSSLLCRGFRRGRLCYGLAFCGYIAFFWHGCSFFGRVFCLSCFLCHRGFFRCCRLLCRCCFFCCRGFL